MGRGREGEKESSGGLSSSLEERIYGQIADMHKVNIIS